jgi:hypothetical protein
MGCQHLEDLYELFLLGTLPEASAAELRGHLETGCPTCQRRVRDATLTVYLLSLRTKRARPNPKLKARLLQRLRKRA